MPRGEFPSRRARSDAPPERRGPARLSRPFAEVRRLLVARARARRNPFAHTDPETACRILERLDSTAHELWVAAFMDEARRHETRGDWLAAYGYARVARYPSLTSAPKREAYARSRELYLRAMSDADPPVERVTIPFVGRPGEGREIPAYLRRPHEPGRAPIVVIWGGIDAFKEERRTDAYLAQGWATLAMDMPGTGESPIAGSTDAERLWSAVFEWIAERPGLEPGRIAVVGSSTGGYWATKLAHTHRERVAAAVAHGGPAHHAFASEWIARAEAGEYPFEYSESLARAFGMPGAGEWRDRAPELSLLSLGALDRLCAPLLLVHGENDTVFPIADVHLVLLRGGPKWWRVFPGGHMGRGDAERVIVDWLRERLRI